MNPSATQGMTEPQNVRKPAAMPEIIIKISVTPFRLIGEFRNRTGIFQALRIRRETDLNGLLLDEKEKANSLPTAPLKRGQGFPPSLLSIFHGTRITQIFGFFTQSFIHQAARKT